MGILEEDMQQLANAIVATIEDAYVDKLKPEEIGSFKKFMKLFTAQFAVGLESKA